MSPDQENQMVRYLLGQLAEQEEAEFEGQYLANDSLFEELLAVEDDLHDAYVREELSVHDGEAFEARLLSSPLQQEKLKIARTLHEYLTGKRAPIRPVAQPASWRKLLRVVGARPRMALIPALSVSLVLLVAGGWWLAHRNKRNSDFPHTREQATSPSTPSVQAGPPQDQSSEARVLKAPGAQKPQANTVAFVLAPGLVRGSQESRPLVVPHDVSRVRLEARFEGDYPRYHALLETVEGRQIWSKGDLEAQAFPGGKRILLDLSSSLLPPGDYVLTLRGLPAGGSPETVAEYAFRVRKR